MISTPSCHCLLLSSVSRGNLAHVVSQASLVQAVTLGHRVPLVRPASLGQPGNQDHLDHLVHLDSLAIQVLLARQALQELPVTLERG